MIKHIELPRLTDGLLAPPGGCARKSGKRFREGGAVGSPNFSPKVQRTAVALTHTRPHAHTPYAPPTHTYTLTRCSSSPLWK